MLCAPGTCSVAQKFGDNATLEYATDGLLGHPGWDIHCGYGSPIEAAFPMTIYSIIGTDSPLPISYTLPVASAWLTATSTVSPAGTPPAVVVMG